MLLVLPEHKLVVNGTYAQLRSLAGAAGGPYVITRGNEPVVVRLMNHVNYRTAVETLVDTGDLDIERLNEEAKRTLSFRYRIDFDGPYVVCREVPVRVKVEPWRGERHVAGKVVAAVRRWILDQLEVRGLRPPKFTVTFWYGYLYVHTELPNADRDVIYVHPRHGSLVDVRDFIRLVADASVGR